VLNRILVPLDGSAGETGVLPAVRQLVGGTGAVVHLVVVRPPPRLAIGHDGWLVHPEAMIVSAADRPPDHPPLRAISSAELLVQEQAVWERCLTRQGSKLAYDGLVVRREVCFGEPVAETLAAARRHAAQLVVVAAPPQGRWERVVRPCLAQQLLAQAAVSVLAVPVERDAAAEAAGNHDGVAV
jgi:nucleotide-binding universal stress UspA family protein